MALNQQKITFRHWVRSGEPFIWLNAAAVTISVLAVVGLLLLLAVRGFGHFWPSNIMEAEYRFPGTQSSRIIGERVSSENVPLEQILNSGMSAEIDSTEPFIRRTLIKRGNRDVTGLDFAWVLDDYLSDIRYPEKLVSIERREWGHFYGYLKAVKEDGQSLNVADDSALWALFEQRIDRALTLHQEIEAIEKGAIASINYGLERLRLRERSLELNQVVSHGQLAIEQDNIAAERAVLDGEYAVLQSRLHDLYTQFRRDSFVAETMSGQEVDLDIAMVVQAHRPNAMHVGKKLVVYAKNFWAFLTEDPREANTEGGIFPAIFGTVMMVLLMSVMVTPFGVIAAIYLREYAKQGIMTRVVRIAVNNLAGVPSIVYGVFGLGFFIYFLGAEMDKLFFEAALPAPTFGTPGLLWASLTLALLTLPVVIVSTEEGLSRIPKALREGSLALGATKAETLWRVVLPMASPAMMTGLILAVARAAGEVAPLMLVGVVKLAPSLPVDGNYPYMHLDQQFMHLGFHIFDVGFQSPNVEAARPLVYATALLLVIIIALLNFSAVALRNHLRERYKALEM